LLLANVATAVSAATSIETLAATFGWFLKAAARFLTARGLGPPQSGTGEEGVACDDGAKDLPLVGEVPRTTTTLRGVHKGTIALVRNGHRGAAARGNAAPL